MGHRYTAGLRGQAPPPGASRDNVLRAKGKGSQVELKHCVFQFYCLNFGVICLDLAMHTCIKIITPALPSDCSNQIITESSESI